MNHLLQSLLPALALICLLCLPVPATAQTPPEGPGVRTYVVEGEALIEWYARENEIFFLQVSDADDHLKRWTWAPVIEIGQDDHISYEFGGDTPKGFARLHYTTAQLPEGETLESWDLDGDGLSNWSEITIHQTNPLKADTDGDGLPDGWEVANGLDPNDPTGDNGADGDPDGDGVRNDDERWGNTRPQDEDDFPVQILSVGRSAWGNSNVAGGIIRWGKNWGEDNGYGEAPEATVTAAKLMQKAQTHDFPDEPPMGEPGVVAANLDLSSEFALGWFHLPENSPHGSGNITQRRIWLRAPPVGYERKFRMLRVTSNTLLPNGATEGETTIQSVEAEEFTVEPGDEYSDPIDLEPLPPAIPEARNTTSVALFPIKMTIIDPEDEQWENELKVDKVVLSDQVVKIKMRVDGVELSPARFLSSGVKPLELHTNCTRFGEAQKVSLDFNDPDIVYETDDYFTEIRIPLNRSKLQSLGLLPSIGESNAVKKSTLDYAYTSVSNFSDSQTFLDGLSLWGIPGGYASNKENVDLDSSPPQSKPHKTFLQAAGCEVLEVSFGAIKMKRMIMNQAEVFYFSGHGLDGNGETGPLFQIGLGEDVFASDLLDYWDKGLNMLIVAGCSIVNINNWVPFPAYSPPTIGPHAGYYPGLYMNNIGPRFILGYWASAPTDVQNSGLIIGSFTGVYNTNQSDPIGTWAIANDNSNGRNATAIEKKNIAYGHFEAIKILGVTVDYVWRIIPKDEW